MLVSTIASEQVAESVYPQAAEPFGRGRSLAGSLPSRDEGRIPATMAGRKFRAPARHFYAAGLAGALRPTEVPWGDKLC